MSTIPFNIDLLCAAPENYALAWLDPNMRAVFEDPELVRLDLDEVYCVEGHARSKIDEDVVGMTWTKDGKYFHDVVDNSYKAIGLRLLKTRHNIVYYDPGSDTRKISEPTTLTLPEFEAENPGTTALFSVPVLNTPLTKEAATTPRTENAFDTYCSLLSI